jgi:hypothetical protein
VVAAIAAVPGVISAAVGNDHRAFAGGCAAPFRKYLPAVDIANVQTGTTPVHHLLVASAALRLPEHRPLRVIRHPVVS